MGLEALQALLKLKSPSNMTPTGDDYYDKRQAAINSGESDFEPSELELMDVQNQLGEQQPGNPYGVTMSRDRIKDSAMQTLRRRMGLQDIAHKQKMDEETIAPRINGEYGLQGDRIKGQFGLDAAKFGAKEASDRLQYQQDMMNQRNTADNDARQRLLDDQQNDKHSTINPAVLAQIAREQAQLRMKANDPKLQPGLLSKIPVIGGAFTPANPAKQQLDMSMNALQFAQRAFQQYPGMSAEDIASLEGQNASPEELAMANRFLMQFRGR